MSLKEIEDKINNEFNDVKVATRDKILGYFINKKLKTLIESIDEFLDSKELLRRKIMVIIRRNADGTIANLKWQEQHNHIQH